MKRATRIRIIAAASIATLALFVVPPIASSVLSQGLDFADLATESPEKALGTFVESMRERMDVAQRINLACVLVAGACFLYILVATAVWFIGPAEKRMPSEATAIAGTSDG